MCILTINSGSATHKAALFEANAQKLLWQANIDWKNSEGPLVTTSQQSKHIKEEWLLNGNCSHVDGLHQLVSNIWQGKYPVLSSKEKIDAIGHRIVHGGKKYLKPVVIDNSVIENIKELFPIAPLHNPISLEGIEAMRQLLPKTKQAAVFDTSFHHTIDDMHQHYPIPLEYFSQDIRRFGFHGISHEFCSNYAFHMLQKKGISYSKLISCHLGSGCSLTAIKNGKSIYNTMGFTPLDGIMMGTRSGAIDPGIISYLIRTNQLKSENIDHLLNYQSGLLGICGTQDMRIIVKNKNANNPTAILAFNMFVSKIRQSIGALSTILEGIDVLTFTGGIGQNSPEIRKAVCSNMDFLNLHIDDETNIAANNTADIISSKKSSVHILIIPDQEELAIAQHTLELINKRQM